MLLEKAMKRLEEAEALDQPARTTRGVASASSPASSTAVHSFGPPASHLRSTPTAWTYDRWPPRNPPAVMAVAPASDSPTPALRRPSSRATSEDE